MCAHRDLLISFLALSNGDYTWRTWQPHAFFKDHQPSLINAGRGWQCPESGLSTEFLFKMLFFLNKKCHQDPESLFLVSHISCGASGGRQGSLFFISLFHQHFAEMRTIDKWDKSKKTLEIVVLCCVIMLNNPGESSLKHIYYCLGLNKYFMSNIYCFALISVLFLWKWNIACNLLIL